MIWRQLLVSTFTSSLLLVAACSGSGASVASSGGDPTGAGNRDGLSTDSGSGSGSGAKTGGGEIDASRSDSGTTDAGSSATCSSATSNATSDDCVAREACSVCSGFAYECAPSGARPPIDGCSTTADHTLCCPATCVRVSHLDASCPDLPPEVQPLKKMYACPQDGQQSAAPLPSPLCKYKGSYDSSNATSAIYCCP